MKSKIKKDITKFYKEINFLKWIILIQALGILCLGATYGLTQLSGPLVLYKEDGRVLSFSAQNEIVEVTEDQVKLLVKDFINRRFNWDQYDESVIYGSITPLLSRSLKRKILKSLKDQRKQMGDGEVSQYVGKIDVQINDQGKIIASFDKILRLKGLPLITESQLKIGISEGARSPENPWGIYINSLVSYDQ